MHDQPSELKKVQKIIYDGNLTVHENRTAGGILGFILGERFFGSHQICRLTTPFGSDSVYIRVLSSSPRT